MRAAWATRWWALLASCQQKALAQSLVDEASDDLADMGEEPGLGDLLLDAALPPTVSVLA